MTGRSIAMMMMMIAALALAGGGAWAGTFKSGTWVPTGCGTEPTPPAINASGRAAYEASVKEAETYQTAAKKYEDCYFAEAQADNHTISTALSDQQHQTQANFDKLSADSKAAVGKLNKKQ